MVACHTFQAPSCIYIIIAYKTPAHLNASLCPQKKRSWYRWTRLCWSRLGRGSTCRGVGCLLRGPKTGLEYTPLQSTTPLILPNMHPWNIRWHELGVIYRKVFFANTRHFLSTVYIQSAERRQGQLFFFSLEKRVVLGVVDLFAFALPFYLT